MGQVHQNSLLIIFLVSFAGTLLSCQTPMVRKEKGLIETLKPLNRSCLNKVRYSSPFKLEKHTTKEELHKAVFTHKRYGRRIYFEYKNTDGKYAELSLYAFQNAVTSGASKINKGPRSRVESDFENLKKALEKSCGLLSIHLNMEVVCGGTKDPCNAQGVAEKPKPQPKKKKRKSMPGLKQEKGKRPEITM